MRQVPRVILFWALIASAGFGASFVTRAQTPLAASSPPDILPSLLTEVRGLRTAMEQKRVTSRELVTQYLTRAEDIAAYTEVRVRVLGDVRPASTLLLVAQLVRPEFLVEVEVMAAKEVKA